MTHKRAAILVITLISILAPTLLFAQSELTLESLNARIEALEATMKNITPGLGERVQALEALLAEPWSPDVVYKNDGVCQSPLHAPLQYSKYLHGQIHQETADAYRSAYGVSINPIGSALLSNIYFEVDSSNVYLEYTTDYRKVIEKWAHCEFLGHSKWTSDD